MKTKTIVSLALVGALISGAFAADYSKVSNEELLKLSAGKIAPKDYPDYRMEIHKRVQEMKVKDARVFRDKLRESRQNMYDKMTHKEYLDYQDAIHLETQKRLDSMSEKEARESGLMGYGYGNYRDSGYGYGYGYGRAGHRGYRDCYNRGYHHFW